MKWNIKDGYCDLCLVEALRRQKKEGVEITLFWWFKVFICESCLSRVFTRLTKGR